MELHERDDVRACLDAVVHLISRKSEMSGLIEPVLSFGCFDGFCGCCISLRITSRINPSVDGACRPRSPFPRRERLDRLGLGIVQERLFSGLLVLAGRSLQTARQARRGPRCVSQGSGAVDANPQTSIRFLQNKFSQKDVPRRHRSAGLAWESRLARMCNSVFAAQVKKPPTYRCHSSMFGNGKPFVNGLGNKNRGALSEAEEGVAIGWS